MITPGIQENLRIINAEKNDKGTLVVTIQQGDDAPADLLASLSQGKETSDSDNNFFFWPFKADDRLTTPDEIAADLIKRMDDFRKQLTHILGVYMPIKDIDFKAGEGLNFGSNANFTDALKDAGMRDVVLAKIYDNFVTNFITMITPHMGPSSAPLRMKLIRASKDKHFANIPRFVPFIEPMSVSKDQSKLKFTPYELGYRKGDAPGQPSSFSLADPTPVVTEGSGVSSTETAAVTALFGAK